MHISVTPDIPLSFEEHLSLLRELYENCGLVMVCNFDLSGSEYSRGIDLLNAVDGDANCDSQMDMSDAVFIMQTQSDPDKYSMTEQGSFNSDLSGDGITNSDALTIQKKLLKLE